MANLTFNGDDETMAIHTGVFVAIVITIAVLSWRSRDRSVNSTIKSDWPAYAVAAGLAFGIALAIFLGYQLMWDTLSHPYLVSAGIVLGYILTLILLVYHVNSMAMDIVLAAWITQSLLTNAWHWQFEQQPFANKQAYLAIESADSNEVTIVLWSLAVLAVAVLRATNYVVVIPGRQHWTWSEDRIFLALVTVWVIAVNVYAWLSDFSHPVTQILELCGSAAVLGRWMYHAWFFWRRQQPATGDTLGMGGVKPVDPLAAVGLYQVPVHSTTTPVLDTPALSEKAPWFLLVGGLIVASAYAADSEVVPPEKIVPILAGMGVGMLTWSLILDKAEKGADFVIQAKGYLVIGGIALAAGVCYAGDHVGGGGNGLLVAVTLNFMFDAFISDGPAQIAATSFDNMALAYLLGHCASPSAVPSTEECASAFQRVYLPGILYVGICICFTFLRQRIEGMSLYLHNLGTGAQIGIILYTVISELAPHMESDELWVEGVAILCALFVAPLLHNALERISEKKEQSAVPVQPTNNRPGLVVKLLF